MAVPPVLRFAFRRISTTAPAGGHRVGRIALLGQNGQRNGVQFDFAQHRGVMFATAGVQIYDIDQLGDGVISVADHVGRLATRRGHYFSAHDQYAIVLAGGKFFHEYRMCFPCGRLVSGHNLLARGKIRGHAAALIAVLRLDHHGQAQVAGGLPSVVGRGYRAAFGSGHAHRLQNTRVSSLSCAIDSAIALVRSVSAA